MQPSDPYVSNVKSHAPPGSPAAMPNVQMAFACESVTGDQGGPVSFQNIMDGIGAPDFPALTGRWLAVFSFSIQADLTLQNCRVIVAHEDGEVIAQTRLKDLTFSPNSPVSRSVVAFQGVAWPHPGRYVITFIANRTDVLASFPMVVQHVPAPSDEAAQSPPPEITSSPGGAPCP